MRSGAVLLAAVALAAPAAAATATPILDRAAEAARGRSVYVHPGTKLLTAAEAARLERQIEAEARGPLYIAILPAAARPEAGGSTTGVVLELSRRIVTSNPPAVHAVVVGNEFRAVNRDIPAGNLATAAFREHSDEGPFAVLSDFVRRVGEAREAADPLAALEPEPARNGRDGSGFWIVGLVAGGAGLAGFWLVRRRRSERELAEVKAVAREDLVALATDVSELDVEVDRDPEAKRSYVRAMEAYQRADDAFDRARSPKDLAAVSASLAEGRFEMESARARLEGRPPPEPREPCFFDPRHGPSVQDVWWDSPYRGHVRVPACAEDARRVATGEDPLVREIDVDGRRRPVWDAPAYFGPWVGGFYGPGLLTGFLAGSMLGTTMGVSDAEAATDWDSGGGDGGDFGGGDFGGGDFGGGDFGGGDFGGGF